jgi:hypothetical protein
MSAASQYEFLVLLLVAIVVLELVRLRRLSSSAASSSHWRGRTDVYDRPRSRSCDLHAAALDEWRLLHGLA